MSTNGRRLTVLGVALVMTMLGAGFGHGSPEAAPKPKVVKGSGDITAKVDEFRALLGADNGGGPNQYPSGRREINWDSVPDDVERRTRSRPTSSTRKRNHGPAGSYSRPRVTTSR